jgi:hypothetical protein
MKETKQGKGRKDDGWRQKKGLSKEVMCDLKPECRAKPGEGQ